MEIQKNPIESHKKDFLEKVKHHPSISLTDCFFRANKPQYIDTRIMSKFNCFLAISNDEGGLFRMSKQQVGINRKIMFLDDIELLAIEQSRNKHKLVLFLTMNVVNCDDTFTKTFKIFFPSTKKGYSCVNQKEERKKYKILSCELKKDNSDIDGFLMAFEKYHGTPELEEIKKEAKNFSEIIGPLALFGKSIKHRDYDPKDEFDIGQLEEKALDENKFDIKSGATLDDVYEKEKPLMLKKLMTFETASFQVRTSVKEFKRQLRHEFMTANRFLNNEKRRLETISQRSRRNSRTPSKLVDKTTIKYANSDNLIVQEEMLKSNEILKSKQKTLDIQVFYSGEEAFSNIEHIFIDASWVNGFMIIPIVTMTKIDKIPPPNEPDYYIYRTVIIFLIEGATNVDDITKKATPKGTNELYQKIIGIVKGKCANLKSVSSDFEASILNGIDFNNLSRWGCYFHYVQRLRTNCIENNPYLSNQCLSILKILPFVDLKSGNIRKSKLKNISNKLKHQPDLDMFRYVEKQYFSSENTFNRDVIKNQNDELQCQTEYFKFTDNASERVFKSLKESLRGSILGKQNITEAILIYLTTQNISYVGGRSFKQNLQFKKSKLGHLYQNSNEELNKRLKEYESAIEHDKLEGISLSIKTIDDVTFGTKKKIVEKKKRRSIKSMLTKTTDQNISTKSELLRTLTKRSYSIFSERQIKDVDTKINSFTDDEFAGLKRVKELTDEFEKKLTNERNARFGLEIEVENERNARIALEKRMAELEELIKKPQSTNTSQIRQTRAEGQNMNMN
jgi:hypothetical protein